MAPISSLVVFWFLIWVNVQLEVEGQEICTWTSEDGTMYDLTQARNNEQDFEIRSRSFGNDYFLYYVNFCGNTIRECNTFEGVVPTPVCQVYSPRNEEFSLGKLETSRYESVSSEIAADFSISFTNGTICTSGPRSVTYEMICNYDAQETKVLNVQEEAFCSYDITIESPHACPANCPRGKKGGDCSICMRNFYGENCEQCPSCKFGKCNDTNAGTGECQCEEGWEGENCSQCSVGRCEYTSPDGKFFYDLKDLAEDDFDYVFNSNGETFYVNILAQTNEYCGNVPAAVCRKTPSSFARLGSLSTQQILPSSPPGNGVILRYTQGNNCIFSTPFSVDVNIFCVQGAQTTITGVSASNQCQYSVNIVSGKACPICTQGRYGKDCEMCECVNGKCNDGINGDGFCTCNEGWTGSSCNRCKEGYYGSNCLKCEPCVNGYCNDTDGSCVCRPYFDGAACNQCVEGHYGPQCIKCECGEQRCDEGITGTGQCFCDEGRDGKNCNECAPGYYGSSCNKCQCDESRSACLDGLKGNGKCVCFAGFGGKDCKKESDEVSTSTLLASGSVGAGIGLLIGISIFALGCIVYVHRNRKYERIP